MAQLAAEGRPITHDLLDQLPQDKSLHNVRQILVHTGVLPQRIEYLERLGPWLEQLLTQIPDQHARLIRPYAHWSVLRRARRTSERRPYTEAAAAAARGRIRAALGFLAWLDDRHLYLESLSQADVDQWLTSGSTHRYEVRSFLAWASNRALTPKLTVPQRYIRQPPDGLPSEEVRGRQLQRCLADTTLPADVRAAGALVTLFGLPLSRAVLLTTDQVAERGQATYLTIDQQPVLIPPRLAEVLSITALTPPRSALGRSLPSAPWLFPGFSPGCHQAAGTLSRRLLEHGIEARCTRSTALLTIAADLPAPILADLLGMHITTATRWVDYARRDWSAYLAARAEDLRTRTTADRRRMGPAVGSWVLIGRLGLYLLQPLGYEAARRACCSCLAAKWPGNHRQIGHLSTGRSRA